jgi:outer membrane receptor for ferrienterochelin and colicins
LRASAGVGFKAPDFRQLYLNFNNTIAGYAVYGAQELPDILREWEKQGQIAEILVPVSEAGDLQAEKSRSFNLGGTFNFSEKMQFSLNIFRNDVSHLIETQIVAKRTNGQNIYGYRNLNSIFTEGIETDWKYLFNANCSFSVGYQFLNVKDKDILTKIEAGEIYRRDPETLATERLHAADYRGLFGRSKHSGNMKFFYEIPQKGISGTMRLVFRGRYGFGDRDGNLIYDSESESVGGYCTWHISFAKTFFSEKIRIQIGIDNLLNYRDPNNIPNLAGRLCWASMSFSLQKKRGVQRTSVR